MNTHLASQCYVGIAHMRCATPAQRYANVPESGPETVISSLLLFTVTMAKVSPHRKQGEHFKRHTDSNKKLIGILAYPYFTTTTKKDFARRICLNGKICR